MADNAPSAFTVALRLLARRELSVEQMRARLLDRGCEPADVDAAIERLLADRSLDDERVAREYARTALNLKGRGRLRIQRELAAMGIARDVAAGALAEVFGDTDERALVRRAVQKKLHGQRLPTDRAARARLYQYLMRQGFSPGTVAAVLRGSDEE